MANGIGKEYAQYLRRASGRGRPVRSAGQVRVSRGPSRFNAAYAAEGAADIGVSARVWRLHVILNGFRTETRRVGVIVLPAPYSVARVRAQSSLKQPDAETQILRVSVPLCANRPA